MKVHLREPSSYTPLREKWWRNNVRSLTLGSNTRKNFEEISKFSKNDANNYHLYEQHLDRLISGLEPLLDVPPSVFSDFIKSKWHNKLWKYIRNEDLRKTVSGLLKIRDEWLNLYEFFTAPPYNILTQWFESEPLIATIASDAVIGSMTSPYSPGSGFVALKKIFFPALN